MCQLNSNIICVKTNQKLTFIKTGTGPVGVEGGELSFDIDSLGNLLFLGGATMSLIGGESKKNVQK